jgi:hypothetical protein
MKLHISDLAPQEEKQKRPCSDIAAYVAGRKESEDGALCNDRANQVVVITNNTCNINYLFWLSYTFLLLCCVVAMTLL